MTRAPLKTLIAYACESTSTQTTLDYLLAFRRYFPGRVDYLHVTNGVDFRTLNGCATFDVNLNDYDIVINNYCARLPLKNYVSEDFKAKLRAFDGLKIVIAQDEWENTDALKHEIADLGFQVFLTCVPTVSIEYVYPRTDLPGVRIVNVLTGYVSDEMARADLLNRPLAERPILIGYRARDLTGLSGRLGFDKVEIGRRMREICDQRGLVTDIRMDDGGRIYGAAWYAFIGSCRAALGTESGSNVFDFDGSMRDCFEATTRANGGRPPTYEEFQPHVAARESEIDMGQLSPRIFEYALSRTPMILYRGNYSGAIEADRHYISLEKDFSNIDVVLRSLEDIDGLNRMVARTYDHLIASGRYSYRSLTERVVEIVEEELPLLRRGGRARSTAGATLRGHPVLRYAPTDAPLDARANDHRRAFVAYEAELHRMVMQELWVIEGYRSIARDRVVAAVDRPGASSDLAEPIAARALLERVAETEISLRAMEAERGTLLGIIGGADAPPAPEAVASAASLLERQVHAMYQLYGALDVTFQRMVAEETGTDSPPQDEPGPAPSLNHDRRPRGLRRFLPRWVADFVGKVSDR